MSASLLLAAAAARMPGLIGTAVADNTAAEEVIHIPVVIHGETYQLQSTLYRPAATGRFPLVVINHGTDADPYRNEERKSYPAASEAFVSRGFAVAVVMRRGYGGSEGTRVALRSDDLTGYGRENALDIKGAIQILKTQPYVDARRIIVVGQSTGGLATMAYLSMADDGVLAGINFHGGVRPHNLDADPLLDARIDAFVTYARTTHVPSLWFYTANDHSSRPAFITRLYNAYQQAGGKAQLVQLGPFLRDGHVLFERAEGLPLWWPRVSDFLATLPGA